MGCWGITAFESDAGLDAVGFIRKNLPEEGNLELGKIIEAMQAESWLVPNTEDAYHHTGPMALAETIVKFIDRDFSNLDYDEDWAKNDKKFSSVTSFTSSKESLQWLRDYISDTLKYAKENGMSRAEHATDECDKHGGWFKESDWIDWQNHMSALVNRMDTILTLSEHQIDLLQSLGQETGSIMEQSF